MYGPVKRTIRIFFADSKTDYLVWDYTYGNEYVKWDVYLCAWNISYLSKMCISHTYFIKLGLVIF